jgi:hypothetical protein
MRAGLNSEAYEEKHEVKEEEEEEEEVEPIKKQ